MNEGRKIAECLAHTQLLVSSIPARVKWRKGGRYCIMLFYDSTAEEDLQVLDAGSEDLEQGKVESELKSKFGPKKIDSEFLSESYDRIGLDSRASRVYGCGSWLRYRVYPDGSESPKLDRANFCKDPLCPMCASRRSLKIFAQLAKVMNHVSAEYRFIFLTLTCRNVFADDLLETIHNLLRDAWGRKFIQSVKFKGSVCGWFRSLEITHDTDVYICQKMYRRKKAFYQRAGLKAGDLNPAYDTYHPHLHVVLAVEPSYFQRDENSGYITQVEWREMWQSAMGVDYDPWVDVRAIYDKHTEVKTELSDMDSTSAIAEASKYAAKSSDFLIKRVDGLIDENQTDRAVGALVESIHRRRLVAYGGVFKKAKNELGLDDPVDGDLVHVDELTENDEFLFIKNLLCRS